MIDISIIGLGYVGLSNALALAQNHHVIAYDIDATRIKKLQKSESPISDYKISEFLEKNLNIEYTTDFSHAIKNANFIIIATPTDYDSEKNRFNTTSIEETIAKTLKTNTSATFIIKSTVPVGYTKELRRKHNYEKIVFSPEFLREGRALEDVLSPSRIIVGDKTALGSQIAEMFLGSTTNNNATILLTDSTEAEAIKLFANTYLANRIAFFNELDTYAVKKDLNAADIIAGVSLDPRIGNHYNNPSFGYGGYCLPKDTKQLLSSYADIPNNLISAIISSNKTRKQFIAEQIIAEKPTVVGVYRLIMKQGSDNFRESSIIDIINILKESKIDIIIHEPTISTNIFNGYRVENDLQKFISESDIIIANRSSEQLKNIAKKVYTRGIYDSK